ncbi:unnamed protein product, partial [Closterium sp. NIES-53]
CPFPLSPPPGGGGSDDGHAAPQNPEAAGLCVASPCPPFSCPLSPQSPPSHRHQVEVAAMTAMQHPKILQLLGYVGDSPSPVLVYEFIPRGDCTEMLKLSARGEVAFPWRARLVVALGCAEALAAIHDANFVHRDFKASNVLLREDLTPVLADFGLAKSVTDWATHVSTRVMGSMGYMDPIYFQTGD